MGVCLSSADGYFLYGY